MMPDYTELREALAQEGLTEGPWYVRADDPSYIDTAEYDPDAPATMTQAEYEDYIERWSTANICIANIECFDADGDAAARYIAAADPTTLRSLLAERDAAVARVAELEARVGEAMARLYGLQAEEE